MLTTTARVRRRLLDLAAAPVAALLLLPACGSGGSGSGSSPSPTVRASATAAGSVTGACGGSDAAAALKIAYQAQQAAASYAISSTIASGGSTSTLTLEFQQPDRLHLLGGGAAAFEWISVGGTLWRKSGGSWVVASPSLNLAGIAGSAGQLNDQILSQSTFSKVSVDRGATQEGLDAVLYRFHQSDPRDGVEADVQSWLARGGCRPIKLVSEFSATSNGTTTSGTTTSVWSKWGQVTIQPPA